MTPRSRRVLGTALVVVYLSSASASGDMPVVASDGAILVYLDPAYSPAERAADLVSRMTLEEKAGQMVSSQAPAIKRLRVRAYGWWNEAIHGVSRAQTVDGRNPPELVNTTSYPVSLSMASTWNPELVHRVAGLVSDEAREVARDNTLDLSFYSPTVNLSRDPRWGRNDETYGEDPVLTAVLGAQYVNGMEGKDAGGRPLAAGAGYAKTGTTLKHYAANNSEVDRLSGSADVDERTLREYYTAQFRAIVAATHPSSIMTAYNGVNGVPASASTHLLQTLGRQTFGFDGFYTSDCDSVFEMQRSQRWIPPDRSSPVDRLTRHAYANAAGVDLNCQLGFHDWDSYATTLPEAVRSGVTTPAGPHREDDLDASLVRLFTARIRLGEFDDAEGVPWVTAARARVPEGTWVNSELNAAVTETPERLRAAREAADESIVLLKNEAPGSGDRPAGSGDRPVLPLRVPASGAYRMAVVGYQAGPEARHLGGYSSRQVGPGARNVVVHHEGLLAAVRAVNPSAVVDLLPGVDSLGSKRLDPAVLDRVAGYDAVVVVAGTSSAVAGEGDDREDLALPGVQATLIREVARRNPNTVAYLETVGAVDVRELEPAVPALLWSSYNGQRKGEALADVVLGRVSPSGHLPFTWYRDDSQLPPIDDYRIRPSGGSPGRTYQYFTGAASYPFGHGLSYTTFSYSPVRLDRARVTPDGTVTVRVDVTNTGTVPGADVVQVYVSTPEAPAALERPVRRLAGFAKVRLGPGETGSVAVPVRVRDLAFFDETSGRFVVDQGRYEVAAGPSSAARDLLRTASLTVTGVLTEVPAVVTATPDLAAGGAAGSAAGSAADGVTAGGPDPGGSRVRFPVGAVIDPRLTVAMADDALSGYLAPGRRVPFPAGLAVALRSNRPDVVRVDPAGVIRAQAAGVATITATVSRLGRSASTTFVVLVGGPP